MNSVKCFNELTSELQAQAGGKGGTLAKIHELGYPVPEGFVVMPTAFQEGKLVNEVKGSILSSTNKLRKNDKDVSFAVRSSALNEDSAQASFAGEFETVLDVKTDEEILQAITTVYESRLSKRVEAYSSHQGIARDDQMAVVVQLMVQPEMSGVLFTADPITGSYNDMIGNYVHGLGEQLVSGEADAIAFRLRRPKGQYDGPKEFRKYSSKLFSLATRLEEDLGHSATKLELKHNVPQDIEWAVAKGKLYILQARPITTLSSGNIDTYDLNESLTGDCVLVNTNVAEALPGVVTPLTWSTMRTLDKEMTAIHGPYLFSGNICGRIYSNISLRVSMINTFRKGDDIPAYLIEKLGHVPHGMSVPTFPFTRWQLIKEIPGSFPMFGSMIKAAIGMQEFLDALPDWCAELRQQINNAKTSEELRDIWMESLSPKLFKAWWVFVMSSVKGQLASNLFAELEVLVGIEDANTLLSNLRGSAGMESLGPAEGISKIVKGTMSREQYTARYGHRGANEFEVSMPDATEDPDWLENHIAAFIKSNSDVEELLNKQHKLYDQAIDRFAARYPKKVKWLEKKLAKTAEGARSREASRSGFLRVWRLIRHLALKAGEITGIGDDVFFLYFHEVAAVLSGAESALEHIPDRKENYKKFNLLPSFPSAIRGRFDPAVWAADPNRRVDYHDASQPTIIEADSNVIKGIPGSSGSAEGIVRVIVDAEEGELLQAGEILVASTTNVGWTPLFPRSSAVITDVGSQLSHAAIVARELGVPAVIGCGNATTRLKTGDRVLVDGSQGLVQIVD
ncbi:MAG: PEP/pyruvate-binding domain-containing protein [Planctomycetota bacterium]